MTRGPKRIGALTGSSMRRFSDHPGIGRPWTLDPSHPAARDGHTLYKKRVAEVDGYHAVLKDGHNNRKIGRRVAKGRWAGMNIYTLTLEERATCPRTCRHWLDCFGNKMNWSPRWTAGEDLERQLHVELRALARANRHGFVVRLHVLGDFYSLEYVACWLEWLMEIKPLHVYGYTAHPPSSPIGRALMMMATHHWDRFAMRFSNAGLAEMGTATVYDPTIRGKTELGIVCPAQTEETECCASCALCWQSKENIVFIGH
jgi:hypothetical protein